MEALPGFLGNKGNWAFISGEQGNKGQILRGTGEQRQYWGTGNIRKQIFDFWGTGEQANLFQGNKGTGTALGGPRYAPAGLSHCWSHIPHCWISHATTHTPNVI